MSGKEKSGGEAKILKRGDKLGQGVSALKKKGGGTPLRTMIYFSITTAGPSGDKILLCR